jgi:hypothetical protein
MLLWCMKRTVLMVVLLWFQVGFAIDMIQDSEQFYLAQWLFVDLSILPVACGLEDAVINFACGYYSGDFRQFNSDLNDHVATYLANLYLASDWFANDVSWLRDYRSSLGQYLISFNPGGYIVLVFIPLAY